MDDTYPGVITRFLSDEERLVLSSEKEMPLVIEAHDNKSMAFLQTFLSTHSARLLKDIATYGAVLLRGFEITSDEAFENTLLSMEGFHGIREAFMSEEGRIHPEGLNFILHTNAVYKTGGTLYLGGFHSENYYSPDVPAYICFCCLTPSNLGGETGLINMEKIYRHLDPALKEKLEKTTFFVSKWLVSDIMDRYHLSAEAVENLCQRFDLPLVGQGDKQLMLMYKPSVFEHPLTKKRALQINFFELLSLNKALRQCFMADYQGKTWFWHRFVWRLPAIFLKPLERIYIMVASFLYSPKEAFKILVSKIRTHRAFHDKKNGAPFPTKRVGACFNDDEIKQLATLMRQYYASCLWKKGDILLVDNRQVVHAGMPGSGPRLVRAMIGNPMEISCSSDAPGLIDCKERATNSIGESASTPP